MPFVAKSSYPNPAYCTYRHPTLSLAARNHRTVNTCLPGYLDTECLLAELLEQGRRVLWLRLEREDGDPATFLLSLLQAVQVQKPGLGGEFIDKMRRSPGPVSGWPPLFHHMAQIISQALGENGALVFEHVHKLSPIQPTLGLVSAHLAPNLSEHSACILISHERLPPAACPGHAHLVTEKDLQLTAQIGIRLAQDQELCIPDKVIQQAVRLFDGSVGALKALYAACDMFGHDYLQSVIQQGHNTSHMLTLILSRWLATFDDEEIQNLVLCSKIEYTHPDLFGAGTNEEIPISCPWLQPLSNGWQRLRCLWQAPLRSALRRRAYVDYGVAQQLAHRLSEIGAVEQAIRLSCDLSDYHTAAEVIAAHTDEWMDLGQWATLDGWIKHLPAGELKAWPRLIYVCSEIAATQGRISEARRTFATSYDLFSTQGEVEGACQSLLAESMLATLQGDKDHAQRCAQSASTLARQAGVTSLLGQANWQLARLAAASDAMDEALAYLTQVAETPIDSPIAELFQRTIKLLRHQIDLQVQCKVQHQAYLETVQAEQNNLSLLKRLMHTAVPNIPELFIDHSWSNTPVMLKMLSSAQLPADTETRVKPSILNRLFRALSHNRPGDRDAAFDGFIGPIVAQYYAPEVTVRLEPEPVLQLSPLQPVFSEVDSNPTLPAQPEKPAIEVISAYLLGSFRLSISDKSLNGLPSSRGLAILKYILVHHGQSIPRDVLMDTFWPEADPESARNSLNVALHSLRQALRLITPFPVICFENGNYRLNPELQVWVDVEEFERHLKAGTHLEDSGQIANAIREYEAASSLYQGDLLADDPYEEWPVFDREHLRIAYLDMLDRLSQIYLSQEQYVACIALCRRILERDNCREDAHRRLMRCYSRQGQQHLALRQYQVCIEALHAELDVNPEPTTTQLAERIRLQQSI